MTLLPTDPKPVAFHAYLTTQSGAPLPFFRLTGERCGLCPAFKQAQLGILYESSDGRIETVGCTNCDFQQTRERRHPAGRRMNGGLTE